MADREVQSNTGEDLRIAFAGVIATIAKNAPESSPTALIGAGRCS